MNNIHHPVLFTARKKGERPYQFWTTAKEAEKKRKIYEKDGWTVTTKDISKEEND